MRCLVAGEDLAMNELMDRWKTRLTSFLYRFTGNESVALDLAEETFVRVYQNREKFLPEGNFSSWLFGIAANLGRNHLRWQRRHPSFPLAEAEEVLASGNPRHSSEMRELESAVKTAIALLPPKLRETLLLTEYENLSQAEIATIAGCSVKAVERRLSRSRELLRKELTRYLHP